MSRENGPHRQHRHPGRRASTEPDSMSRENAEREVLEGGPGDASTEPDSMSRENLLAGAGAQAATKLQRSPTR